MCQVSVLIGVDLRQYWKVFHKNTAIFTAEFRGLRMFAEIHIQTDI